LYKNVVKAETELAGFPLAGITRKNKTRKTIFWLLSVRRECFQKITGIVLKFPNANQWPHEF
jgi:hypothetical protein